MGAQGNEGKIRRRKYGIIYYIKVVGELTDAYS
jgi:hypothetical protein